MPPATTRKDLPDDERLKLYHELLETKVNGRLPHGRLNELLDRYGISRQTLSKVWQRGQRSKEQTGLACVARRKKGRSGRPPKRSVQQIEATIKAAAPHLRMTLATLSTATGIPPTTLWRLLKTKKLRRRISRIKPMMTDKHKTDRVSFARSFVRSTASGQLRWHDMLDRVHIDEKWFYITLINRRYYLWHDEDVPIRRCTMHEESLKIGGDNAYKLPHMHKDKLARQGPQNPQLACDPEVVSVIEEMNSRKEFERRVDNLSGVLASCAIKGTINMSNIDNLCAMAHDMDLVDNDEE